MENRTAQIKELADLIHAIRPQWDVTGIRAALGNDSRPMDILERVALSVARDPLARTPAVIGMRDDAPFEVISGKPPWCGECDPRTRLIDEDKPRRCPTCHPFTVHPQKWAQARKEMIPPPVDIVLRKLPEETPEQQHEINRRGRDTLRHWKAADEW